jgi:hypothetical protein
VTAAGKTLRFGEDVQCSAMERKCQVMNKSIKRIIKRWITDFTGYSVRDIGSGVGGVELLHDASVLLGQAPGKVLFDIGANVGQTAQEMIRTFCAPQIYCFEPSPVTFEGLKRNIGKVPGITCESAAVGEAEAVLPFHVTREYSVNDSVLAPHGMRAAL